MACPYHLIYCRCGWNKPRGHTGTSLDQAVATSHDVGISPEKGTNVRNVYCPWAALNLQAGFKRQKPELLKGNAVVFARHAKDRRAQTDTTSRPDHPRDLIDMGEDEAAFSYTEGSIHASRQGFHQDGTYL